MLESLKSLFLLVSIAALISCVDTKRENECVDEISEAGTGYHTVQMRLLLPISEQGGRVIGRSIRCDKAIKRVIAADATTRELRSIAPENVDANEWLEGSFDVYVFGPPDNLGVVILSVN